MSKDERLKEAQESLQRCQSAFDAAQKKVEQCEQQLNLAQLERDLLSSQLDEAGAKLRQVWESE